MQLHDPFRVGMPGGQHLVADSRRDVELFEQFARQTLGQPFVRIAFAAGKFPEALEVHALRAAGDQEAAVSFDHGGGDHHSRLPSVVGHRSGGVNGKARHPLAIGQTRHFGLRATQIIAPKSISAWLKSNTCRCGITVSEIFHRCRFIAWLLGSPAATKTRNSTRATLVSRIAARSRNAKLRIAPAVYAPIPLNESSVASSDGSRPPYLATDSRAIDCSRFGRMLYPRGYHVVVTSCSGAFASSSIEGYLSSHSAYFGSTRSTWVCCSMNSETRMWYGSSVLRHGRSRPWRPYHVSSRCRNRRRSGGGGIGRGGGGGVFFGGLLFKLSVENLTRNRGNRGEAAFRRRPAAPRGTP